MTIPFATVWLELGRFIISVKYLLPLNNALDLVGLPPLFHEDATTILAYPSEKRSPGINHAFLLHLCAGLSFIITFTAVTWTVGKGRWHKFVGYVAVVPFLVHVFSTVNILVYDIAHHSYLTKAIFCTNLVYMVVYFYCAIHAARRQLLRTHRDMILICYLVAAEGAANIRLIGTVQFAVTKYIPEDTATFLFASQCQQKFDAVVSPECQFSYLLRLYLIRVLTLCIYAAYFKFGGIPRRDCLRTVKKDLWSLTLKNVVGLTAVRLSIACGLENVFDPVAALSVLLACSHSAWCIISDTSREKNG